MIRQFPDSYAVRRQIYTAITGGVLGIALPSPVRVNVVPPMLVPFTVSVLKFVGLIVALAMKSAQSFHAITLNLA